MKQAHCRILASGLLSSGHGLLQVDCTPLAQPARAGQFLMVRLGSDLAEALRRPLFFSRGGHIGQLLFHASAPWQQELARLQPEETLDVLGPLGQPFILRPGANHLLVLALTEPVAPAFAVAYWAQRQQATVSVLLGRQEWQPLADLLPAAVECGIAPSQANAPPASSLQWADQVFAVVTPEQLPALSAAITSARLRLSTGFAQVLLPADFACGVGACGACTLHIGRLNRRICADGPIFDLSELL